MTIAATLPSGTAMRRTIQRTDGVAATANQQVVVVTRAQLRVDSRRRGSALKFAGVCVAREYVNQKKQRRFMFGAAQTVRLLTTKMVHVVRSVS